MALTDSLFLRACRGEQSDRVPVWFMRQAGRSLPEYRALRGDESILEAVRHPELAAEVTLQPVRRYGVDAAILFSDIVVPLAAIGFGVEIEQGRGPIIERPFERKEDLQRLRSLEPSLDYAHVIETVQILVEELDIPLIGFAGAPFTVASYLIEGGPSRTFAKTKALMHQDPILWFELLDRLAALAAASLVSQVVAGASAVQLFDSWAGALSRLEYERFVLPHVQRVFDEVGLMSVPRIYFGVGTSEILDLMASSGSEVMGIDWRVSLGDAARRLGGPATLQGNLDPAICLAPRSVIESEVERVLREGDQLDGHIFNLGHGVLPETEPHVLCDIVELVHSHTRSVA